jgi:hypothetical protein
MLALLLLSATAAPLLRRPSKLCPAIWPSLVTARPVLSIDVMHGNRKGLKED